MKFQEHFIFSSFAINPLVACFAVTNNKLSDEEIFYVHRPKDLKIK